MERSIGWIQPTSTKSSFTPISIELWISWSWKWCTISFSWSRFCWNHLWQEKMVSFFKTFVYPYIFFKSHILSIFYRFLTDPEVRPDFHPNKTTLQWYFQDYQRVKSEIQLYECTLRPGEIIYFPDKWWHATLNLDTSVFISTFLSP